MKPIRFVLMLLLVLCMIPAFAACGGSSESSESGESGGETAAQEPAGTGCTYDLPKTGYGFELPESLEITEGFIDTYDMGEMTYRSGISMGWPVYWDCTEKEYDALTEETARSVATAVPFQVLCVDGDRSGEDGINAIKDAVKEANDGEIPEQAEQVLAGIEQIHQEGEYTWYMVREDPTMNHIEKMPEKNQAEFEALFDATDTIMENMKFCAPQVWRGAEEGTGITFETKDLDGNTVTGKELFSKNKITMINIWGTYCGPCINEMPELEKMSKEYADQGGAVVGLVKDVQVGDDTKLAEAKAIVKDTGVTFTNLRTWDGYDKVLSAPGTPTTYFVNSQGEIVGDPVVGENIAEYRKTMEQLLEQAQ